MEHDRQKWIDNVLESTEGSKRAKPAPGLFERIESRISAPESTIVSAKQWRMVAAAAIVLLALNVFSLLNYSQHNVTSSGQVVSEDTGAQQLISNFNLYDE